MVRKRIPKASLNFIFSEGKGIVSIGLLRLGVVIGFSVLYLLHYYFFFLLVETNAYHGCVCKTMFIIPMSTSWYIYICFSNTSFSSNFFVSLMVMHCYLW